jgi:hypothetical protein
MPSPYKDVEKRRAYVREHVKKHYDNNSKKICDYKKKRYIYKKECRRMMNILIE